MSDYPIELSELHQTLENLKGIENVCSGIDRLEGLTEEHLSSADFAHLPIATLLRTKGGLENESMIQVEFTIDASKDSLISLEFLSWFVRDQARNGKPIQLRSFALPPQTPNGRQLGQTLKFHMDYFFVTTSETLQPIPDRIADLTKSLKLCISLYEIPLRIKS